MKLLQEYFIREVTYKYESEVEKEFHKKKMIADGFRAVGSPRLFDSRLSVTYLKKQLNERFRV